MAFLRTLMVLALAAALVGAVAGTAAPAQVAHGTLNHIAPM
jgi:hypothetical protein